MADNTDGTNGDEPGGRVYNFPRLGFNLTPTTVMDPPPASPNPPAPGPAPAGARAGRRSPLDIVGALPAPGALQPFTPASGPAPQPGQVPDTFRSEPAGDLIGPRLGALGLAATLAVAVAALRGAHTVLSTWWENRQARQAETQALREARAKHTLAMQQAGYSAQEAAAKHQAALHGIGQKAAEQRAKQQSKVPSSSEFGRKTLGGRTNGAGPGGKGGGSSADRSAGSGRTNKSATQTPKPAPKPVPKPNQTPKPAPKPTPAPNKPNSNANGRSLGPTPKHSPLKNQKPNSSPDDKKKPQPPKSPHRGSQGASDTLKKRQTATPPNDRVRTTLPQAVKNRVNDAAQKRLERRRNNGIDPVLRKNPQQPGNKPGATPPGKTPVNLKKTPNGPANQKGAGNGQQPAQAAGTNTPKKAQQQPNPNGLGPAWKQSVHKAAARRWKRRQKRGQQTPPVWGTPKKPKPVNLKKKPKKAPGGAEADKQRAKARNRARWAKARAYARNKAAKGGCFGGTATPGPGAGQNTTPGAPGAGTTSNPGSAAGAAGDTPHGGPQTAPGEERYDRGYDEERYDRGYDDGGDFWVFGTRRSPFENAARATADESTYTFERADRPTQPTTPGDPAALTTGVPALDAAPTVNPPRPGTTRPRSPIPMPPAPVPAPRQDPRIVKAKKQAARAAKKTVGRQMDARHATDITLDGACGAADKLTSDAFKTHAVTSKLAHQADRLAEAWLQLAEDAANENNLIGDLYTSASIKFAESMELVKRMAQEMSDSSLEAAEKAETAGNEINDAYRPITQATADAGLTTPSAPVHNEV